MAKRRSTDRGAGRAPGARGGAKARTPEQRETSPRKPCHGSAINSVRKALEQAALVPDITCAAVLRRIAERTPSYGSALGWLAFRDGDAEVRGRATGLLVAAGQDPAVPALLGRRALEQARPVAREAFSDPAVTDEVKQACLAVLTLAGEPPSPEEAEACFQDLAGSLHRQLAAMARDLPDAPGPVEELLRTLNLLEDDALEPQALARACVLLRAVGAVNPAVAATALCTAAAIGIERALPDEEVAAALELAAEAHPGRARWLLEELLRWPLFGSPRALIEELVGELAEAEIAPLPIPCPLTFAHGFVTQVDGAGSRSLLLAFARGDGAHDVLLLLLNDQVGIKDAYGVWEEGAEAEAQLRALPQLLCAPCDLARARALVGDALARHAADRRPVPGRFLPLRGLLGEDPLPCTPCAPELGSYLLETFARTPTLMAGSEQLARLEPFEGLGFDSDAAFACVRALGAKRPRAKAAREAEITRLLEAVEGSERERLVRRLGLNLELLARMGQGRTATARTAAGVYLALNEGLVPWTEVPYLRALAEESLVRIRACLAAGFQSQAEANAAALEQDRIAALGPDSW